MISMVDTLPEDISIELDKLLNPQSEHIEEENNFENNVSVPLSEKLEFIGQVEDVITQFNVTNTTPIDMSVNYKGTNIKIVDGEWYEPYRQYVKGGISLIIWVLYILASLRMALGIFNIGLGKSVSLGYGTEIKDAGNNIRNRNKQ